VVVPSVNSDPDATSHVGTGSGSSSGSVAETEYVIVAPPGPVASTEMVAGSVSVGAVLQFWIVAVIDTTTVLVSDPPPSFAPVAEKVTEPARGPTGTAPASRVSVDVAVSVLRVLFVADVQVLGSEIVSLVAEIPAESVVAETVTLALFA
jgi:hypothetical protein